MTEVANQRSGEERPGSVDALANHPYRHPRVDEMDKAEFIKQTAVMIALTEGATFGRMYDWRCGAERLMDVLRGNGFEVTAVPDATERSYSALEKVAALEKLVARLVELGVPDHVLAPIRLTIEEQRETAALDGS